MVDGPGRAGNKKMKNSFESVEGGSKKARKSACAHLRPLTPACARFVGKIFLRVGEEAAGRLYRFGEMRLSAEKPLQTGSSRHKGDRLRLLPSPSVASWRKSFFIFSANVARRRQKALGETPNAAPETGALPKPCGSQAQRSGAVLRLNTDKYA